MKLSRSEIRFDDGSVIDPAGRVFHYASRVFRAIPHEYAPMYREFLTADFIQDMFSAGLIETWITDSELDGYGLVVEHKRVPVLSSWTEWCSAMIKDATEMLCGLNLKLFEHGYVTKDTQPGNIQFVDGKPYWIDFGSIVRLRDGHTFPFEEFRYHSLLPLWLLTKGYNELAKEIYKEVGRGYLKTLSTRRQFRWLPFKYTLIKRKARNGKVLDALEELRDFVRELTVRPNETVWTDYGQGGMPPVDHPNQFGEKATAVYKLMKGLTRGTLLDLGGNKGWYAELAAYMGHRVVSTDIDDAVVCNLHRRVTAEGLPILPLVLDFRYPTAPFSIGLGKASAFERLYSDTTLTLALVHHLVFKQNLYFDPIVEIISKYTRKNAIIEFVPKEDRYVSEWYKPRFHWYTLDNFVRSLKGHFCSVEIHDSWPEPRQLLLCTK